MKTIANGDKALWRGLVSGMDIPEMRKDCTESNLKWFLRNGAIRNMGHFNIQDALALARKLLRS